MIALARLCSWLCRLNTDQARRLLGLLKHTHAFLCCVRYVR